MVLQADQNNEVAGSYLGLAVDGTEQVRVLANGNVGIRTDSPTHALHVNGQARIPEVIFAPNNNGASDKSSIVGAGGVVQIYSDSTIDFYESDNNTREFRFNVGSGDFDFSGNLRRTAGTLKCPTGEVMVGFDTAGMICEEPTIIYN